MPAFRHHRAKRYNAARRSTVRSLNLVTDFVYCPYCGEKLNRREIFGRRRPVCPDCGYVQFPDPKVAVIALVTWQDCVLLIQRAIQPMQGMWALPGGYMDAGEMPQEALARELQEEVGLDPAIGPLVGIFPMVGSAVADEEATSRGIVLAFHVALDHTRRPAVCGDDDVADARWFRADNLPNEIAFDSTHELLRRWHTGTAFPAAHRVGDDS